MNFHRLNSIFSVKSKTIIFVLFLYFVISVIFFFVRYLDIRDFAKKSQSVELKRVESVYKETVKRVKKFYTTRGYANINSYGIKESFKNRDSRMLHILSLPRWRVITKENPYLKSFDFYDNNGNLLTYFGDKPQNRLLYYKTSKKPYDGFWHDGKSFDYHTVSEARDKESKITGFIVFKIDPKYFLNEIEKLTNIHAYIIYRKSDGKKAFILKRGDKISNSIDKKEIRDHKEFKIKEKIFLPYILSEKGKGVGNDFKIVFLQDITHWKETIQKSVWQTFFMLVVLALITTLAINYGFEIILKELKESRLELEALNKNLRTEVEKQTMQRMRKEREANEKERILSHQSRLASMGEMIGNIAHQWRQPLTQLSSILINLEMFFERGKLTKERFEDKVKEANKQIFFMSRTIDDFRNFFVTNKKKVVYKASFVIQKVQNLMSGSLKNNNIEFIVTIEDDFEIYGYPNEIAQALLNIISNAKDVLLERGIKEAKVEVTVTQRDKKAIIIRDNAGGIKISPIEKIFEPYFSTKHAKSGTGIGLYMTKTIIEKNNNGKIVVENSDKGAIFTIIFYS